MRILGQDDEPLEPANSVVTIGVYDGVHLGHQRTLARVVDEAHAAGQLAVVATFDRHPAEVVRPDVAPLLLCNLEQRLERLAEVGVDVVAVVPFDATRAQESAQDFVAEVLVGQLGAARIVVGEDFRFGKDRQGDVALLTEEGARLGFSVEGVALGEADGDAISSTRIRALLRQGDVAAAATLLGRLQEVAGEVVHGDGRGGPELGFPTANVHVPVTMAIPAVGIYAGFYSDPVHGRQPAAISVGRRPTFYAAADPLIEAHLIGFDGDLYGQPARITFLDHLRDEEKFDSVEELIDQMAADVDRAATLCAAVPPSR